MRVTGERVVPKYNKLPELNNIYQKHIARYLFVSKFVENKFVLDAGCGCGYGSDYIANYAKKVIGIDSLDEAIKYSKKHYTKNNLEFQVMDCTNLAFPNNYFDVICSFEVIEHLKDYKKYLSEMFRVLKGDGVCIVSTPNKKIFSPNMKKPRNLFHYKEFYFDEFKQLLLNYFSNVTLLGQDTSNIQRRIIKLLPRSLIDIIPLRVREIIYKKTVPGLSSADIEISKNNIENSLYFIAICKK